MIRDSPRILSVYHCLPKRTHILIQLIKMSPVIKTTCCECGRKIKCSSKYGAKLYSCNKCSMPECPKCSGVDIVYKVVIFKRKKTTIVERCIDPHCQWSLDLSGAKQNLAENSTKQNFIEVITID